MPIMIVPKVTINQVLIVPELDVTLGSMTMDDEKAAFSARLNEICDEMDIPPKGQARQTTLAKIFDVTQKGARKWLESEGYPAMDMARRIAVWSGTHIEWLLTGRGPKRIGELPPKAEGAEPYSSNTTINTYTNQQEFERAMSVREAELAYQIQELTNIWVTLSPPKRAEMLNQLREASSLSTDAGTLIKPTAGKQLTRLVKGEE